MRSPIANTTSRLDSSETQDTNVKLVQFDRKEEDRLFLKVRFLDSLLIPHFAAPNPSLRRNPLMESSS